MTDFHTILHKNIVFPCILWGKMKEEEEKKIQIKFPSNYGFHGYKFHGSICDIENLAVFFTHILRHTGICLSNGSLFHKKFQNSGSIFYRNIPKHGFIFLKFQKKIQMFIRSCEKWVYILRKSLKMGTVFCQKMVRVSRLEWQTPVQTKSE